MEDAIHPSIMDNDKVDLHYLAEQAKTMLEFTKDRYCTDFRLKAGSKTIHVHRAVLSTHSDYFKSLCKSGMTEAVIEQTILCEDDGDILSALVEFMYLGKTEIKQYNVESLLLAADFTMLAPLKISCEKFMIENLSLDTLISYHQLAKKAKLKELRAACERLSHEKFNNVVFGYWFLSLSVQEVRDYLLQDGLNVDSEDQVLEAIVRWISNCEASSSLIDRYVQTLFPCLRLPLCSRAKLAVVIGEDSSAPEPLKSKIRQYNNSKPCQGRLVKRSFSPATASAATAMATPTTAGTSSDTAYDFEVVLVGGHIYKDANLGEHRNVVFMEEKNRSSSFLTRLPGNYDWTSFSVCATPDGFIVSGGHKWRDKNSVSLSCVKSFSVTDQMWTDLPDMLYPCSLHASVCGNNRFFTLVGQSQKGSDIDRSSVCMLDLNTLAWAECQSLESCFRKPGVAAVEDQILVVQYKNVCKYDTQTGNRKRCQPMLEECDPCNHTVAFGKKVFVLNRELFMVYDVVTDQWSKLPCPIKPVIYSAMVLYNGRLLVTGGYTPHEKTRNEATVQTYDIENGKWWLEKNKLPLPLWDHTAIVVKIPHSLKIIPPAEPSLPPSEPFFRLLFLFSLLLPLIFIPVVISFMMTD